MKHWHIGVLFHNIDEVLDYICTFPGETREKWTISEVEFGADEMVVGNGGRLRTAMGRVGGVVYELIQPMDGNSFHAHQLKERGAGLHHNAYIVEDDMDETVSALIAAGGRIVWEARHGNEHVCYVESPEGALIWEIINCCPFMPSEQ